MVRVTQSDSNSVYFLEQLGGEGVKEEERKPKCILQSEFRRQEAKKYLRYIAHLFVLQSSTGGYFDIKINIFFYGKNQAMKEESLQCTFGLQSSSNKTND